jgi:hypothetical protein
MVVVLVFAICFISLAQISVQCVRDGKNPLYTYTVILISAKMAEIHLKLVEYAQFKFAHLFWSNFVQFGRNSIHGWFVCADSGEIPPVWKHFDTF